MLWCYDIQTWHEILGHCNYDDVSENVTKGMKTKGKIDQSKRHCEICIQGKFVQNSNKEPDVRAEEPLELVHTDLSAPISPLA